MGVMIDAVSVVDAGVSPRATGMARHRQPALGKDLRQYHDAICHHGMQLQALHDDEMARLLQGVVQSVVKRAPQVVVVGQDQAGKTTLINALIARPAYLPTGVGAATQAVTCLHFAPRSGPKRGARVAFLSRAELRARSAPQSLQQRLSDISEHCGVHADVRHGPLLGSTRDWANELRTTAELRPFLTDTPERLADIVKSVDLYFEASPLGHPVTLIDTPALAGRSAPQQGWPGLAATIECADAVIVVLGTVDAARDLHLDPALEALLLRIPKDRIIVYVNDKTTGAANDETAHWAAGQERLSRLKVLERLLRLKLHQDLTVIAGRLDDAAAAEPRSGGNIAELIKEISSRMLSGPFARRLTDAAAVLRDVAETREMTARSNAVSISNRILDLQHDRVTKERTLERIQRHIEEIRLLCDGIERTCNVSAASVRAVEQEGEQRVRESLERQLTEFLAARSAELRTALRSNKLEDWRCDTVDWRRQFEEDAVRLTRHLRLKLFKILHLAVDDFRQSIKTAMPDVLEEFEVAQPNANFRLPAFEIPVDPIALKLEQKKWNSLFKSQPSSATVVADFRKLIIAELDKTLHHTVEQMKAGFAKDAASVLYRLTQKSILIIGMMVERREQLVKTADGLIALRHEGNVERLLTVHVLEKEHFERVGVSASKIKGALDDLIGLTELAVA